MGKKLLIALFLILYSANAFCGEQVFANFCETTLAADISDVATSLELTSDTGFPTISGGSGDWFIMVLADSSGNKEIVKCTARAGTTCTVTRAQEGTGARAWTLASPATAIYVPVTKGALEQIQDDIELRLAAASNLSDLGSAATALGNLGLTATAAEVNQLDGVTVGGASAGDIPSYPFYEIEYFYNVNIANSDYDDVVFSFVPAKIVIQHNGSAIKSTSSERGSSFGNGVITITGTDTCTLENQYTSVYWSANASATLTSSDIDAVHVDSGADASSNMGSFYSVPTWTTSTKTLRFTWTVADTSDGSNEVGVTLTAFK